MQAVNKRRFFRFHINVIRWRIGWAARETGERENREERFVEG